MDLTERKAALERIIQQATQQIGQATERLIGARAQLALLDELAAETPIIPRHNGTVVLPGEDNPLARGDQY